MDLFEYTSVLIFCIVIAAILGAVMGSFLNCAAWRITHGESFLKGRSRCPECGHVLGTLELIPVFSWLFQKGRCKNCGNKISVRYPLTEILFAAVTVICLLRCGFTIECLRNYIFICCLFCLTLTDLEDHIIPDGCHIISAAVWFAALPFTFVSWAYVGLHVLSGVVFGGGVLLISLLMDRILKKDTLGGGDIKLIAVMGLYLGFAGALLALILACIIGLVLALFTRGGGEDDDESNDDESDEKTAADSRGEQPKKSDAAGVENQVIATEAAGAEDGLIATEAAGAEDGLIATEAAGAGDGLRATEAAGAEDGLIATEATGAEDSLKSTEVTSADIDQSKTSDAENDPGNDPDDDEDDEPAGAFPFGPAIAIATAFVLLFGAPVIEWYLNLF